MVRGKPRRRGLGYEGGYDAVRRFAKGWSQSRGAVTAEAYVPLYYAPGEAYQFDWSHEVLVISGVTVTVKVAHIRLCHSRMMPSRHCRDAFEDHAQGAWGGPICARARSLSHRARTYGATMASMFDAHDRAFAFFKGTCTRGIYDSEADKQSIRGIDCPPNEDGGGGGLHR